jgi:hypothetical protein
MACLATGEGGHLLTARLSGHQIMINGHALFSHRPPSWLRSLLTLSRGRGGAPEAKRGRTLPRTVDDH